jgi:tetratricopeptide (TPR) repeat protein
MGLGNASARFNIVSQYPENYVKDIPGYEIITFGYNEGVDIQISPEDDFKKVVENFPPNWMPDYCIMYNLTWNLLPKGIEHAPFPTVYLALDWDYHIPLSKTNAESVDFVIVGGDYAKETVKAMGANNVEAFYDCGIMKEFFPSSLSKIKDRKYDIFYTTFIDDVNHLDRSMWILKLCELSKKYNILISPHLSSYREYLSLLHDSKLALSHNRDGHMSFRVVEAGSQGTVVLDTGREIKKYFDPNRDYIPITEDDFFRQVDRYLNDEGVLQDMSDRFYSKVIRDFESRKHFVKIVELADKTLKNKQIIRKYNFLSEDERFIRRGEIYYFIYFRGVLDRHFINQDKKLLELSIEEFKKAIAIKPTPRAMTNLAVVTASLNSLYVKDSMIKEKGNEAISILNDVISSYPAYAVAHFNLGLVHLRVGDKEEALSAFTMALTLFRDKESTVDLWCLYSRELEYEKAAFPVGKSLDTNLLLLIRSEKDRANENIRRLYQAATLYYIYCIEKGNGNVYKALETNLEACNLYPESGLLAMDAAKMLALLGYKKESLTMYKRAIELLPLNIDLKIEYIKLLYLYKMDKEALNEINNTLMITRTVGALGEKATALKTAIESLGRFNSSIGYSHDSCIETILHGWVEALNACLRKDTKNLKLILRIIEIWHELGRTDKIFEIIDDYCNKHLGENIPDDIILALKDVYNYLQKACDEWGMSYTKKLNKLNSLISNLWNQASDKKGLSP